MNYSKFDKIDYDAESDDEGATQSNLPVKVGNGDINNPVSIGPDGQPIPTKMTGKTKDGRLKFEYQGRTIYEWEQSLDEVNIYLNPPPGLPRKMIDILITHTHLKIGVLNTPPFIDEDLGGPVKVDECTWTLVDGELNITLCKMNKGETWTKALSGRDGAEVDPVTKEELRKKMMLERFQEEVSWLWNGLLVSVSFMCTYTTVDVCDNCSTPDSTFRVPTSMARCLRHVSSWAASRGNQALRQPA
jgi:hypothetical protein